MRHFANLVLTSVLFFAPPVFAIQAGKVDPKTWEATDKLISEQKFQAALDQTLEIAKRAGESKQTELWTQALIRATQLQLGLHGYETSVRFMMEQEWPKDPAARALLNLYFAAALMQYQNAYGWEIGQREKTVSAEKVDLKEWTTEQIGAAIGRAFDQSMTDAPALDVPLPEFYVPYFNRNNYPQGIRPTLRDVVVYLAVEHLANSVYWSPQESNEIYKLPMGKLALATGGKRLDAGNATAHPLARLASWLAEHREFHSRAGRAEAALEAHYELLSRLHNATTEELDRTTIREQLRAVQAKSRSLAWWARGQALLADFIVSENRPGKLIDARAEAQKGAKAFPDSIGAKMCVSIVASIEQPAYDISAMSTDGVNKASLLVNYKNLEKLYFRAYTIDLDARLREKRRGTFLGVDNLANEIQTGKMKPVAEWNSNLAKTGDYAQHRAILTPKLTKPGHYVIVVASRPDFQGGGDQVMAVQMTVTDLFLLTTSTTDGGFEARILNAEVGTPLKGVGLELYRFRWEKSPEKAATYSTDADGYAKIPFRSSGGEYWNYVLLGRKGPHLVTQSDGIYFYEPGKPGPISTAFVFTDRSIYRPQQKIQWKVVAYSGEPWAGRFQTANKGAEILVQLMDPNGEVVAKKSVKANQFGTAAGEFEIPTGRLLGQWRVQAVSGSASTSYVRVEEYKRPTFEASFPESKESLRLNQKAKLIGEAKYYFGLPVASGKVSWRITREEVTPWWWSYWGWWSPGRMRQPQTVASGSSSLQPDGTFQIEFTPEADKRLAKKEGMSYNFAINADITDDGGETRSASKTIRLGFVAIEASVYWTKGFFSVGEPVEMESRRSSLNGAGRKGKGKYRVVALVQPATTPLPAELPAAANTSRDEAADLERFGTPDDKRRTRWETNYDWQTVTRNWKEGGEIANGEIDHDADGKGKIKIQALRDSGVYRVFYETKDEFGATFKISRDFFVAEPKTKIALPFVFEIESGSVVPGGTARFLLHSGLPNQAITVEVYRQRKLLSRRTFVAGKDPSIFEMPIKAEDHGGFTVYAYGVRDYQLFSRENNVNVPWDDKRLEVTYTTFRDRLRPGGKERFTVTVKDYKGRLLESGAAELLAYMYDRSLDLFGGHTYPSPESVYPWKTGAPGYVDSLRQSGGMYLFGSFPYGPGRPSLWGDHLQFHASYGIGGMGRRGGIGVPSSMALAEESMMDMAAAPAPSEVAVMGKSAAMSSEREEKKEKNAPERRKADNKTDADKAPGAAEPPAQEVRSNFSETAFFQPSLVIGPSGAASFEFVVPDSVTSWKVYAHAITRDMRGGSTVRETQSVKELMVRPYIPRFLREGDSAEIKVVVNNASEGEITGDLTLDIEDPDTGKSVLADFGMKAEAGKRTFKAAKSGSATLTFSVTAPKRVGLFAFRVTAKTKKFSDGELRPFPVLPSRMHLAQSRFVTLKNKSTKTMEFKDLAKGDDPTLLNEKMVVTVDGQLFYGVLQALPYLIKYPYECAEQTLNRFLSTGIVSSVFKKYPAVATMAKEFSKRKTRLEKFDEPDANRRMQMEESPWLNLAKGGKTEEDDLVNVLDAKVAAAERDRALKQIAKMQLPSGAWPWFPGGPPDQYMTLYMLMGFSRALEFKIDVPKDLAVNGWKYIRAWLDSELQKMMGLNCCHETITMVNFVLSSYPDASWTGGYFDEAYRKNLLDYSFRHWKAHAPLLKGYLALTLKRMNRAADAKLVFDSVLDSAKNSEELGTYWAPEDRSWLWYNDTVESQAFALRTLMELDEGNKLNEGLVQWLFLNKKLNHWKSTKATAEAIYSLVHYLDKTASLGTREAVKVDWGTQKTEFVFEPDKYTGKKNQIVLEGEKINPKVHSKVTVEKLSPGFAFASMVWHFSTEKLPDEERGDFFNVSRRYFRREQKGGQWTLTPIAEGDGIKVGDQVEIQVSLRTKHAAEYVHLRDPRAAGMEPENAVSGYKWDLGIFWYEEIRDSGENFFFSQLPVGEYTFKYRVRANMAGKFKVGPATVQSLYAPEFNAYSKGDAILIR